MTDIKIPISAPGATAAQQSIIALNRELQTLVMQEQVLSEQSKEFNAVLAAEASTLNTQVSPALRRAREEARTYNDMMSRGRLAQGRTFLAGSSLGGGGGGAGEGPDALGHGGFLRQGGRALSRVGGEVGQLASTVAMAASGLTAGFGALAVGVLGATMVVGAYVEKENRRLDLIEAETKLRQDLNKSLADSKKDQEDNAKGGFKDLLQSRRFIASTGQGGIGKDSAQGITQRLEATGDPEIFKAAVKFMKSRQGGRISFDKAMTMAEEMAGTGRTTVAEAFDKMGSTKGKLDPARMLADTNGGRRLSAWQMSQGTEKTKSWEDYSGASTAYDMMQKTGRAGMRDSSDPGMFLPSLNRDLKSAIDPLGESAAKFKKALDDTLVPLAARAEAEGTFMKGFKEFFSVYGTRSEGAKLYEAEQGNRRVLGTTR